MSVATLMMLGSKGDEVREVQTRLRAKGFDPGPIDGDFGPLTDAAGRRFQAARQLQVDGVVGPQTLRALREGDGPVPVHGTLVDIGLVAERDFGLTVGECSAPGAPARWGPVHAGHSPNSFHFKGRAFDAGGSAAAMRRFSAWVTENFSGAVTELIHNPNGSIKNGGQVDPSFWGDDTWLGHGDHVHLAI